MTADSIVFYFFAAVTILSALGVLVTRNVLHGAFLLMLCFFCVAALYVHANATFIGVTQLLIYVGGILVLMIFGIMLTNKLKGEALMTESNNVVIGILIGAVFFSLFTYVFLQVKFDWLQEVAISDGFIEFIGVNLLTTYLIPFEIAAVLLLVALIGAAVLSERRKEASE